MARLRSLSSRAVDRLKVEKDTVFWDRELTGFGVRVYATGGKVYVAPTAIGHRQAVPAARAAQHPHQQG